MQEQAKKTNTSDLFSSIGALVGLVAGGGNPVSAALGGGLGSLLGGGNMQDAVHSGVGSLMSAATGGKAGVLFDMFSGASPASRGANMAGLFSRNQDTRNRSRQAMAQGANNMMNMVPGMGGMGGTGGMGGIANLLGSMGGGAQGNNVLTSLAPLVQMYGFLNERKNPMGSLAKAQFNTGERTPGYKGTAAPDFRYMAGGGMITGPGTGTSDSIPARIYQRGRPVQEARLSDGEFVMTERAVRGMGNGNRAKGAANMYRMMNQMEGRA